MAIYSPGRVRKDVTRWVQFHSARGIAHIEENEPITPFRTYNWTYLWPEGNLDEPINSYYGSPRHLIGETLDG